MSIYIDRKYLGFVTSRLDLYKQKSQDLYNFRCPYCNDSKKNRTKARGYLYRKANDLFFRCHNCAKSTTFGNFLKDLDTNAYKQYALERYSNGETGHHNYQKPDFSDLQGNAFAHFANTTSAKTWDKINLESIEKLPEGHYARDYIKNRKIPQKYWNEVYYTPKFKDFLDAEFPDHGKEEVPNDDRIILLYTNEKGEVTNIAGRALSESKIRYITIKVSDEKKLFGMHRVRKQEKIYVLEGQFDSYFLPNAVASGDSNLGSVADSLENCDCVLVYDNEPRNKDIVKQIEKSVDKGYKICLFPDTVNGKDVNDMIQNGLTIDEIKAIIDSNTFSGLTAKLKFTHWKRC